MKKVRVYSKCKEYGWLMLKRPELPNGFQGRVLKDSLRGQVSGYTISLDTVLSLVDGEITGWYFGNLNNHTSGSIQWYVWAAASYHPVLLTVPEPKRTGTE